MFFIGTIPAFVSFFAVALLTHYGDWDPVLVGLKKLVNMNQEVIERYIFCYPREYDSFRAFDVLLLRTNHDRYP